MKMKIVGWDKHPWLSRKCSSYLCNFFHFNRLLLNVDHEMVDFDAGFNKEWLEIGQLLLHNSHLWCSVVQLLKSDFVSMLDAQYLPEHNTDDAVAWSFESCQKALWIEPRTVAYTLPSLWPRGIDARLWRNRWQVWFLTVSDIYHIPRL